MTAQDETTANVLKAIWTVDQDHTHLDEDCSPTKVCRNMKDVTFDGYAEPGSDLGDAWRAKLNREGKLSSSGSSLRDLVLGEGQQP